MPNKEQEKLRKIILNLYFYYQVNTSQNNATSSAPNKKQNQEQTESNLPEWGETIHKYQLGKHFSQTKYKMNLLKKASCSITIFQNFTD